MKNEKLSPGKIKDIETRTTRELEESIQDPYSAENAITAFHDAVTKLYDGMGLYYLEIKNNSAVVRRRSDDSAIFMTNGLEEVEILRKIGVEKKLEK